MKTRIFHQDLVHRPHSSVDFSKPMATRRSKHPLLRFWRKHGAELALVLVLACVAMFVCYKLGGSPFEVSYLPRR